MRKTYLAITDFEEGSRARAEECGQPVEAGKGR